MTPPYTQAARFVEPAQRGRRAALWVFASATAAALAVLAWWPVLMAHLRSLPPCDRLPWFQGVIALQGMLIAALPALLLAAGLAARRSGRGPPPRLPVPPRTRVLRDAAPARRARWLIAGAAACALLCVVLAWRLLALTAAIATRWPCA